MSPVPGYAVLTLRRETRETLRRMKIHPNQSYDEVIALLAAEWRRRHGDRPVAPPRGPDDPATAPQGGGKGARRG